MSFIAVGFVTWDSWKKKKIKSDISIEVFVEFFAEEF